MKGILSFLPKGTIALRNAQNLKRLRSIYKHAGLIRSAHIHLGLLEQYALDKPRQKQALEETIQIQTAQFLAKRSAYIQTVKRIPQGFLELFKDTEGKEIERFFKKRIKKLGRSFARPSRSPDEVHKNRKKIKNLLYIRRMLPKRMKQKLRVSKIYLSDLQSAIGQWHDLLSVLEFLKNEPTLKPSNLMEFRRRERTLFEALQQCAVDFTQKALVKVQDEQRFSYK